MRPSDYGASWSTARDVGDCSNEKKSYRQHHGGNGTGMEHAQYYYRDDGGINHR